MTDLQKIIKYCAIAFGVFLTVSIVGGICVVLTIPRDHIFADAGIQAGAGKVQIDTLSSNTLMIDGGIGSIDIEFQEA